MIFSFEESSGGGTFWLRKEDASLKGDGILKGGTLSTIVYNHWEEQKVVIDDASYIFPKDCVLALVANQHFIFERPCELVAWQFNREFYCIADHDKEVGCVGFLFYGIRHPAFIRLTQNEMKNICLIEKLCIEDMEIRDRMQGEMLRTLLKRLIISVTRIAKEQTEMGHGLTDEKLDLVRKFNLLLEGNFRDQHEVRFYANALNKSPKTLSNHFALFNYPPPSKVIQQRIVQEAKRYLFYTDKTGKEIAYLLGFANPAHFSRYFKQYTGSNISDYKRAEPGGAITGGRKS
jgi:AraC family transcriptional regulator, transcriptional activator of pobA